MQRRTSLRSLFGPLGLLAAGVVQGSQVEGHTFDWSGRIPDTTDSNYNAQLTFGPHNHVTCDGVEIWAPIG